MLAQPDSSFCEVNKQEKKKEERNTTVLGCPSQKQTRRADGGAQIGDQWPAQGMLT